MPCVEGDTATDAATFDDVWPGDPAPGCNVVSYRETYDWGEVLSDGYAYDLDAAGKLVWATSSYTYGTYSVLFTYNADGTLATWEGSYPDGNDYKREEFRYDAGGRLVSVDVDLDAAEGAVSVGNVDLGAQGPVDRSIPYTYDADGKLISGGRAGWWGLVTGMDTFAYDDAGRLVTDREVSGDVVYTWTYDEGGELLSYEYDFGGEAYWVRTYTYDADGNLLSDLDESGTGEVWTYDADDRVTTSDDGNELRTYHYSAEGLLAWVSVWSDDWGDWGEYDYTYDADGRLAGVVGRLLCGARFDWAAYEYLDNCPP